MKKIDVTQPYAMTSPFADGVYSSVSTSDFEIPADTSTAPDDTCVIDDGFLPITSTDLDDGGIAPERKNFNGMFYLSTDQRFYLQNGGFITYNSNVATAIGGYPQDAVLGFIDGQGTYKLVRSLIDDNTNDFTQDETLIDGEHWEEIAMGGGSSRNVGEIVTSTLPLTDAGLHLLNGALLQYGSYQAFIDYIADLYTDNPTANYFTDETTWQSAVTTYGVCGKFVYDSVNNTVRLPKYSNKIYTQDISSSAPVVGNGMTLGLNDGTKNLGAGVYSSLGITGSTNNYGSNVGINSSGTATTNLKTVGVTTDPTKSGIITDLANITTSLDGYYYIVVATSTKTNIQVDIDEIATDLNGKADVDLSNCTKPYVTETYNNGNSWYRVWSDGWIEQGGLTSTSSPGSETKTINLLKDYTNTNYTVLTSGDAKRVTRNSNSFSMDVAWGNGSEVYHQLFWYTCGY